MVPLLGDRIEVAAERHDGFGVEREEVFAARMDTVNQAGGFKNAKMLGHALASEMKATS